MDSELPERRNEHGLGTSADSGLGDSIDWLHVTTRIRNGDTESFQVFYDRFFDSLYRQVSNLLRRDESTCLDVVQEVFLKVIVSIKPIGEERKLNAWTRVVARTVTYDWLRREIRRQRQTGQQQLLDHVVEPAHHDASWDEARLKWIERQLQRLPKETQKLIALRYRLGWSLKKIGQAVGLKTGAVDGRIRRAIDTIRSRQSPPSFDQTAESSADCNMEHGKK